MAKALGIVLPVQRGKTGYFNQSYTILDQARSNLTNLILTKKGERVMQPNFGCDVHSRVYDAADDTLISNITSDIESAAAEWLNYISIKDIKVSYESTRNKFYIQISFSIINNPAATDTIVVSF